MNNTLLYIQKFVKEIDLMLNVLTTHTQQGHKETSGGCRYGHYLDFGDSFTDIYIRQNLSNCIS